MTKQSLLAVFMMIIGFSIVQLIDLGDAPREAPGGPSDRSRLSDLLGSQDTEGYEKAIRARNFRFPQDHGPHPGFRNEWWYLTGNLDSEDGQRFGYELTFFRFALAPQKAPSPSNWQTNQVYIAHFALTDAGKESFHVAQRFSRGALGLAGAQDAPFRVWIDDWSVGETAGSVSQSPEHWRLTAEDDTFALQLTLDAEKSPVPNGDHGLSRKSSVAGNASYYYSISRLKSAGHLRIEARSYPVSGLSWLDREWSSSALSKDQAGWDWFALQLSDGSDLMLYNLRSHDGGQDRHSAGTWIEKDGKAQHLDRSDFEMAVLGHWQSPQGGNYPAEWQIRLPELDVALNVSPIIANQELVTTVRYWEGAVDVTGRRGHVPVQGRGYVELTGYAQ